MGGVDGRGDGGEGVEGRSRLKGEEGEGSMGDGR